MTHFIRRQNIQALFDLNGTKFISVRFQKKSGDFVTRNFHPRSKVGLAANPSPSALQAVQTRARNNPDLVNMRAPGKGWRSFSLDRVTEIHAMGKVYHVV